MSLLIFVLVLSFLVIIHELGHFLTAKWAKMRVEEFGFGYPPKLKRMFTDKAGTEYTLNWLPFGGFVRLFGEDGSSTVDKKDEAGAFYTKPVWKRLVVVMAGTVVNFLFGVLAFGVIYTYIGIPTNFDYVLVEEVVPMSPAEDAGLETGDEITAVVVDGDEVDTDAVEVFIEEIAENRGESIVLRLSSGEEIGPVYIRTEEETPEGEGSIGVVVTSFGFVDYPIWQKPFIGMWVGLKSAVTFGFMLVGALFGMVKDMVTMGQVPDEVAGPVGIVHAVSREGILEEGWMAILNFAAILSINLAIINALPFPALDGGRAVFLVVEGITKKRVKPGVERWMNTIGFAALLILVALVSVRDVARVVQDEEVRAFFGKWLNL